MCQFRSIEDVNYTPVPFLICDTTTKIDTANAKCVHCDCELVGLYYLYIIILLKQSMEGSECQNLLSGLVKPTDPVQSYICNVLTFSQPQYSKQVSIAGSQIRAIDI